MSKPDARAWRNVMIPALATPDQIYNANSEWVSRDEAESLLSEAESRIVNMENSIAAMRRTRDEMQGNLIALQAKVDAVREVVTNSSGHISAERILAALGET